MDFVTDLTKKRRLVLVSYGIVGVLGFVLFVLGSVLWDKVNGSEWIVIVEFQHSVPVMLILVGLVIVIIGFLGYFGTVKQHQTMLLIYAVVFGIIIIIQLAAGILAFKFKGQVTDKTENNTVAKKMTEYLKVYNGDTSTNSTDHFFNSIMLEFECCGMNNNTDWNTLTDEDEWTQDNVPDVCCVNMTSRCGWAYIKYKEPIHKDGCLKKVQDKVAYYYNIMGYCACFFLAIKIPHLIIVLLQWCSNGKGAEKLPPKGAEKVPPKDPSDTE